MRLRKIILAVKCKTAHMPQEFEIIDRFQSRDHFTIGRHIGAHVNSELVSREL